jgi:hypothetical protein
LGALRWEEMHSWGLSNLEFGTFASETETLDGSITHHELHELLHIQEQVCEQTKETGRNALSGIVKDLSLVKVDQKIMLLFVMIANKSNKRWSTWNISDAWISRSRAKVPNSKLL